MTLEIWHNPRCSKSRQTLALLEERGLSPDIIKYLDTPPSAERLAEILARLGRSPRELMRTNEADYKAQGLADKALSDQDLIAAMVATPKLIERPVVITADKAAVGRPPESVLEIL